MALKTTCQTPGAVFHTKIKPKIISLKVDLPQSLDIDEQEALLLEANLHNVVELVLAKYFKN